MLPGRLIFDRPTKSIRFPQNMQSTDVATQNDSYILNTHHLLDQIFYLTGSVWW